ncbi:MAG: YcfL family protein [Magnetococcales bacterium]|nr:YcfL family protein [Magnetococcales bacterium]MBF0585148.1 YcfL family protein [Magnetococcales bacterium]
MMPHCSRRYQPNGAILLGLLCIVLTGGCQSLPQRSPDVASKVEEMGLMLDLQPGEIRVERRNHLLYIQAEVINPTLDDQSLSYRFRWLDASGLVLEEEAWKPLLLHGKQRQFIKTVAPTPQAVDFRIEMHAPNNSTPTEWFAH